MILLQFNHTMIRVKDPKVSLQFYTEILGMDLLSEKNMGDFTLYFLGYGQNTGSLTEREGILELTHNHGTEKDPSFQGYASGNTEPGRGFGHIAITVDNLEQACERFERLGVAFKKKPSDGKMKHIAFILDPDGYWIEILPISLSLG